MNLQVVEPAVSRAKFERELQAFRQLEEMHRQRGWWVRSAAFPLVEIAFLTPNCRPAAIAACVRIDFTNYDLWPPSVVFVDPFSGVALAENEIAVPFLRMTPSGPQRIVQGHAGRPAFLCLPGVREYHDHPAHSGDPWLLHRGSGEGGLQFLVDKISTYGSESVTALGVQMQIVFQQQQFAA